MQELTLADFVGLTGVVIVLIAYFFLQIGKITIKDILFSLMNAIGSFMILYSLLYNWNLASFIIEFFWISISLLGIYNYYKTKLN